MKTTKFRLVVILMFASVFAVSADDDKPIRFDQLPKVSRDFIGKYFNEKDISYSKVENDFFSKSYEVFFVDGSKVEFEGNGEWETVDCLTREVPLGIAPGQIVDYVKKHHSQSKIVKIDRDKRSYEIELDNDIEIKFDKKFNVIEYDN